MNSRELFKLALNIDDSWLIKDIKSSYSKNDNTGRIDIYVDYKNRKSENGFIAGYESRSIKEKVWYYANIFYNEFYIHTRLPETNEDKAADNSLIVPWEKDRSLTLLFEAYAMYMMETQMPVQDIAFTFGVNSMSIFDMMHYWNNKKVVIENNLDGVCTTGQEPIGNRQYNFPNYEYLDNKAIH